jgi:hypothetical protein
MVVEEAIYQTATPDSGLVDILDIALKSVGLDRIEGRRRAAV